MRWTLGIPALVASVPFAASTWTPASTERTDSICSSSLKNLNKASLDGSLKTALARKGVPQTCDPAKVSIRRDYSTLSKQEKLHYSSSVKCLMGKPSKLPEGMAPGAKSRYDDFIMTHVNLTPWVHGNGNFLAWHRYYMWAFERALQDECGYKGFLPYWDWVKSSEDVLNSPYFDGSEESQGGNGVWVPHDCTRPDEFSPCIAPVVEGRGGGCVESGPYSGVTVNVSAIDVWFNVPNEPNGIPGSYQPRCMKRDISPEVNGEITDTLVSNLIKNSPHISTFQDDLQVGSPSPHGSGHFTYGGNPGGDVWVSPGDPMFWLHHGNVDRVWWCWQNQDIEDRMFQIAGNRTWFLGPPEGWTTASIDDMMTVDYITPAGMPLEDPQYNHVSSMGGPYCYIYA